MYLDRKAPDINNPLALAPINNKISTVAFCSFFPCAKHQNRLLCNAAAVCEKSGIMYFAEPETSAIINNEQFLNRKGTRCIGVIDRGKEACRLKQVWQTIEQFDMLAQGDRVLLGVSGGPDSVALLHLLDDCRERYGLQLFVVHVNHKLRPAAEEEARYVERLAQDLHLPCRVFAEDVAAYAAQHGLSVEQAGHEVRFACFRQAAQEWQCNKLALGHHRDDRAESVLLHLIQGCGLDGLTAMPPKDGWLIRPLAQVSKQEIVQYCQQQGWRYYIDQTNLQADCLRNQVRLELLPQMRQYNPQIAEALVRLQEICGADADYLEQCTAALWRQYGQQTADKVLFPADILRQQHKALQRRLLRFCYRQLVGSEVNLSFAQTEQMLAIVLQRQGSQQCDLADAVRFFRRYDQLGLERKQPAEPAGYCYSWNMQQPLILPFGEMGATMTAQQCAIDNRYQALVDADKLAALEVRSRLPGDVVQLAGKQGHKKLKKFFIDKKVPAAERSQLPLVVSDGEIVWIPGYFLADCVKITGETKRFCILQYVCS